MVLFISLLNESIRTQGNYDSSEESHREESLRGSHDEMDSERRISYRGSREYKEEPYAHSYVSVSGSPGSTHFDYLFREYIQLISELSCSRLYQ